MISSYDTPADDRPSAVTRRSTAVAVLQHLRVEWPDLDASTGLPASHRPGARARYGGGSCRR